MENVLLKCLPAAQRQGICWRYSRPPVMDIEFEIDLHGVTTEWQS